MSTAIGAYADFDDDTGAIPGSPASGELRVYNVGDILNQKDAGGNIRTFVYADAVRSGVLTPVGRAQSASAEVAPQGLTYYTQLVYLGKVPRDATFSGGAPFVIHFRITNVPGNTGTTCLVGLCTGPVVSHDDATLTYVSGSEVDMSSAVSGNGSPMTYQVSITGGSVAAGDDLWAYLYFYGVVSGWKVRSGEPDDIESGCCQTDYDASGPTNWSGATACTLAGASGMPWLVGNYDW